MKQSTIRRFTRRTVLRTLGAGGLTLGVAGVGTAQPDDRGRGAENRSDHTLEAGRPDHHDFDCPEGMKPLGTFEFVTIEDDEGELLDCYFQQDDGEFHITITGYDTKDDEACEPVTIYYESDRHDVGQVTSFGGNDSHVDDEPDGIYESNLETNGGQQAAISLLHFCGFERGTGADTADSETASESR